RLRPDIVHTRNWTCIDAIIGARLAGVPAVIHGEHGREAADPEGRNRRRQQVRRLLSPFVSEFVTVSRDLARWLVVQVRIPASGTTSPSSCALWTSSSSRRSARAYPTPFSRPWPPDCP